MCWAYHAPGAFHCITLYNPAHGHMDHDYYAHFIDKETVRQRVEGFT